MKRPSVNECLAEVERLKVENERLNRLVKTQRPELEKLRDVECSLREYILNGAESMKRLHADVCALLGTNGDDLPGFMEMLGILSDGRERVYAAIDELEDIQGSEADA